jgi:hypothetical protein
VRKVSRKRGAQAGGGGGGVAHLPAAGRAPACPKSMGVRRGGGPGTAQGCSMSAAGRVLPAFKRSRRESPQGAVSARDGAGAPKATVQSPTVPGPHHLWMHHLRSSLRDTLSLAAFEKKSFLFSSLPSVSFGFDHCIGLCGSREGVSATPRPSLETHGRLVPVPAKEPQPGKAHGRSSHLCSQELLPYCIALFPLFLF